MGVSQIKCFVPHHHFQPIEFCNSTPMHLPSLSTPIPFDWRHRTDLLINVCEYKCWLFFYFHCTLVRVRPFIRFCLHLLSLKFNNFAICFNARINFPQNVVIWSKITCELYAFVVRLVRQQVKANNFSLRLYNMRKPSIFILRPEKVSYGNLCYWSLQPIRMVLPDPLGRCGHYPYYLSI